MYKEKFAQNLKNLMNEKNLGVTGASQKIGIPKQTLSNYLAARRTINLEHLVKIANYFNEDLDYLTGRKDY